MRMAWEQKGIAIEREFTFTLFAEAIEFVNNVAGLAEAANHHPDILIHGYRYVRVTLSTHNRGQVTEKDWALARQIEALVDDPVIVSAIHAQSDS